MLKFCISYGNHFIVRVIVITLTVNLSTLLIWATFRCSEIRRSNSDEHEEVFDLIGSKAYQKRNLVLSTF